MKKIKLLIIVMIICVNQLFADTRTDNIDLFLVVDKSLSMEEEIESVKEYLSDFIVSSFLIPGDNLLTIIFYGKAETAIKIHISDEKSRLTAINAIESFFADGRFTDIGNALDQLKKEVENFPESGRKKYLLLLTDGIQEAPPESKYWSENGQFNHAFLENTKTIRKKGWKIQILGLGSQTAAKEIAEQLSGAYSEVAASDSANNNGKTLTAEIIKEATEAITGILELENSPEIEIIDESGLGFIRLEVKSKGYTTTQEVSIAGVYLNTGSENDLPILSQGTKINFSIEPEEIINLEIPVQYPPMKIGDEIQGEIYLIFASANSITPGSFFITASVKKTFPFNLIIFIAGLLFLVMFLFFFIRSRRRKDRGFSGKETMDLTCLLSGKRELSKSISLGEDERIYICTRGFGYDFLKSSKDNIEDALAFVKIQSSKLIFETLKPDILKTNSFLTGNILGKELKFIVSEKDKIAIQFITAADKKTNG